MKNAKKGFQLLKDVLLDVFQLDCVFYDDINKISIHDMDRGLREMMWSDYQGSQNTPEWIAKYLTEDNILILKSNLGFYNILITMTAKTTSEIKPVYILVSAFLDQEVNAYYFDEIIRQSGVTKERMESAASVFRLLPVAKLATVLSVIKRTLGEYYPAMHKVEPVMKTFLEEKHTANLSKEEVRYLAEFCDDYKKYLMEYVEALGQGDGEKARIALLSFLSHSNFEHVPLPLMKQRANQLNDYSAMAIFATTVHPRYVMRLQRQLGEAIESSRDENSLSYLPYDICHKYILLIKNNRFDQYSKIVRDVIDFIELHMDEELSLEVIANHFSRNGSTLSAQFTRETGSTLTQYIKQVRVHEAIRLLNTTNLPISEIAVEVGYEDFAYFSRVFKQLIGISPRAYRDAM